ncbi:MAG: hypothetical protein GX249_01330 [Firmicutes bacterium]|nr:hypothetical protein [Bacillota bacterium]
MAQNRGSSDAAFFQTFSHQDIMLIFEVFQAMELPELIFDLAALAMVLYPNEEAYVDLFHDLVRRQEEVKQ